MPELPEVETTARLLRPALVGRRVEDVIVHWPRTLTGQDEHEFRSAVVEARITAVGRRAKLLLIELERSGHAAGLISVHLRMTGRLVVLQDGAHAGPYVRVSLPLDRGVLHFLDVRKFGRMGHHEAKRALLDRFGPEPLGAQFTVAWLRRALGQRRRALKPLLLDQEFLAGLGNIYVDEVLFQAGLHPLRRSDRIRGAAVDRLHAAIRAVLAQAIEREGSSFDSFYRTPEGRPGSYQHQFKVYARQGLPCTVCERTIKRIVVGQRGTHLCTRCQRAPRRLSSQRP